MSKPRFSKNHSHPGPYGALTVFSSFCKWGCSLGSARLVAAAQSLPFSWRWIF
ncbi:hypothetical protein L228DRAFT_251204 [Xylona heveae TC161]|uniref:Uncharacterized protein n=1 Tax=Xylona heveae (strain CBS 132557 / TC161) TaxID=1328760 RepID=A0A164ZHQ4_XYLHT|nr:hypothetical protein L228DRAFT_251204 [Xylona heveae TC161]KZF19116.1 hypothetical protein L228DRAFT_251204 [Xylona heveae TC161]